MSYASKLDFLGHKYKGLLSDKFYCARAARKKIKIIVLISNKFCFFLSPQTKTPANAGFKLVKYLKLVYDENK